MDQAAARERRIVWALWAAAVLAAVGGVMPFVLGGTASRLDPVVVPFWAAAIALGLCAVLQSHGKTVASTLYFVAGVAILYGLLSLVSLPVRLGALGACTTPAAECPSGLPVPLADGEVLGMETAAAFGILAILVGYYGLALLYRRRVVAPEAPPVRRIPPMAPAKAAEPKPEIAVAATAGEEEPELPAPEALPELPAHESTSSTT